MRLFYSILFCSAVFAQTAQISSSKITYFGSHFMHDWVGVSSSVSSEINYNKESNTGSVSAGIRLDSFDSKLSSRDSNMLFYTEAIDYPIILFNSNKINIKADSIFIEGDLTFHGVTKQIKTVATMFTSENPEVKGSFSINLSDYNVERPALLFVKIRDEIRIDYSFIIK
tara:strand:- start:3589 stop:4098 length:510 start_codon:yes stop_codon:yes gene_type:complete